MTDLSRISKKFYQHPKARKARSAEPGSISLWLFGNCWCRDHRTQGVIPKNVARELGSEAEIKALTDAGLWRDAGDSYVFNDWSDWNPDMLSSGPKTSAIYIVQRVLGCHPKATQDRLAAEVEKLIDEGVPRSAIEAGLRTWGGRADARFAWLAYYVSDAIRQGESGIHAAIKEARRTLDMSPLAEFGYRWHAPDPPDEARSAKAIREFMRRRKLLWLDDIEASVSESTE